MKPEKVCSSNDRIRQLLDHFQINQTEFCKKTGINKSALSNYLSGNRLPRQDQLYKIADSFEISAAWLMGYNVPMSNDRTNVVFTNNIGDTKPSLVLYGHDERVMLYAKLLEMSESCTTEQIKAIVETMRSFKESNKNRLEDDA